LSAKVIKNNEREKKVRAKVCNLKKVYACFTSEERQVQNGLKGQRALSSGHRPEYKKVDTIALKGQKLICRFIAFALSWRRLYITLTQSDALGYRLSGLSDRL
jgi:hypothetical protein